MAYAIYFVGRPGGTRSAAALECLVIAAAAWAGEETCIRLYGFYGYGLAWWPMLSRVPALVVAIWPMVVQSARAVVRELWPDAGAPAKVALVALVVAIDASLIESVAVASGLWSWVEPGYLGVPLVGLAGWVFFSAAITAGLDLAAGRPSCLLAGVTAVPLTHALLLLAWWGGLRWGLRGDLGATALVAFAPLPLLLLALVARSGRRLSPGTALARIAAACVFFALLARLVEQPRFAVLLGHTGLVALPYVTATLRPTPRA
jgi:hypothetical protein